MTPTPKPLAGQESIQRRLGLDDDAYNYLMECSCRMADHLRETGMAPMGCWFVTFQTMALLGACTLSPSQSAAELADAMATVMKENMPDALASAIDFVQHHLPTEGGGGENALESAWDDRVNPQPVPHGVMQ